MGVILGYCFLFPPHEHMLGVLVRTESMRLLFNRYPQYIVLCGYLGKYPQTIFITPSYFELLMHMYIHN